MARVYTGSYSEMADDRRRQMFSSRRDQIWDSGSSLFVPSVDTPIPIAWPMMAAGVSGVGGFASRRLVRGLPAASAWVAPGGAAAHSVNAWRYTGARHLGRMAGFTRVLNPLMWKMLLGYWAARGAYYGLIHSRRMFRQAGDMSDFPLTGLWTDRTNRSRAISAMRSSHMNARSLLGNESLSIGR